MTYEPQPGDIGLVAIGGGVGRAIRIGQYLLAKADDHRPRLVANDRDWADYQHAFVYLGVNPDTNIPEVIEAEPGGARIRPLTEYQPDEIYWCSNIGAKLTGDQRKLVVSVARGFEGTPYSFLDYFVLTLHKEHLPVPFLQNYVNSTHHMICSQLAARSYDLAGVPLFDGEWPGDVDPLDLFLLDRALAG